jgi:hypothetical protein
MKVPQRVEDIARMSRLFYFALIGSGVVALLTFDSNVRSDSINAFALCSLILKVVLASYFFLVCGANPGY